MNTWNLRDEILAATHRWYVIIAFILAGSLLGWGASYVVPSPYRATLDLYVGLNAYRSPYDSYAASLAGQSFRMVDDYKHWQMEQLNALVLTDPYLEEVLVRLRAQDPSWGDVSIQDFRQNLDVLWRNVGEWHLVLEEGDPQKAVQAVETWGSVIHEKVSKAIAHSKQVVALDIQMTSLAERWTASRLRLDRLGYVHGQLLVMKDQLESMPVDRTISSADHWRILSLVSQVVAWDPAWENLLESAPLIPSTQGAYQDWLEGVFSIIEEELAFLPGEIAKLDEEFSTVEVDYVVETQSSAGLASTLVIERSAGDPPRVEAVRHNSTMSLVGGIIGFLSWGIWVISVIDRKNPS